jgi:hypothetical protein
MMSSRTSRSADKDAPWSLSFSTQRESRARGYAV